MGQRVLLAFLLALGALQAGWGQAYCSIRELKSSALSNGVQIMLKADGILSWDWDANSRAAGSGRPIGQVSIRFAGARLAVEKTLYDINLDPVSTAMLMVPQDAQNGLGAMLQVTMTQPSSVEAVLSEDRQTFLLTVKGPRTVERLNHGDGGDAAASAAGAIKVSVDKGLISVRAVKANIHQLVSEIARQGNISAAVDDAVRHDVSISVQDRAPLEVLRGIAAAYGLALSTVGDVYMLSEGVPADLSTYQRSSTNSYAMRYLKASDAKSLLPSFLFKYVHDNPEQNAVVVTAPSQMLDKIGKDLRTVDVPPPMILVECAVVELTDSNDYDSTFSWRYHDDKVDFGTDNTTGMVNYTKSAVVSTASLQLWLQKLMTQGRAKVEAHPSMAAVNGKAAEIFIGSQRFIKVQALRNGVMQERLETVPVGVRLNIRPSTGGNQEITTWIKVEVSNIVQIDPQSGVPLLGTRRAETTMRTRDGETIILGGLSLRQEDETKRRIPGLGGLPLIGSLFRSKSTSANKTELVLLIRPRLMDENGRLPAVEDTEMRQHFLQPDDRGYGAKDDVEMKSPATGPE
ncbi:MAG TPA: type II and III secretion system protein [Armatimonadota bacterium]|jgi:type II secretory pathway component GspD/PulD (secretin)